MEKLCSDTRERHCKGPIDHFQCFLAAARSHLDLFFKYVAAEHSHVATKQPKVHATKDPEDRRTLVQKLGAVHRPEVCLPIRDVSAFHARIGNTGKPTPKNLAVYLVEKLTKAQQSVEAKVAQASGMRNLQVAMPPCQKPQRAPSNGPTQRRQPTSSTALSQASQQVFRCCVCSTEILHIANPPSRALPVRGNGLLQETRSTRLAASINQHGEA